MDNLVSAKYFIVKPRNGYAPAFMDVLNTISAKSRIKRERDIGPEKGPAVIVRLERLDDPENGYVTGELIRKQTENIPPEANNDGLTPIELSEGGGLAYSSAFCFHPETSCLLVQSNPIAVSQSRLAGYLSHYHPDADYVFDPVVKKEAWTRFNNGAPRKFAIKIASPGAGNPALDGEADTVGGSAATVAEALGAPYITIEVSMGAQKGSLARNAVAKVLSVFKDKHEKKEMDIRSLTASVKEEGRETDVIDFLDEYLVFRESYDLPSKDTDLNYKIRKNHLKLHMQSNISYIRESYLAAAL